MASVISQQREIENNALQAGKHRHRPTYTLITLDNNGTNYKLALSTRDVGELAKAYINACLTIEHDRHTIELRCDGVRFNAF